MFLMRVNERFFQYLGSFNIFEGQELVGGAEFVLTGGRIAVAEFQLNTLPGRQCTVVHHLAAREKLSAVVPRLGQPGAGPRLPSRLRANPGQGPCHAPRPRGEKGRAEGRA